MSYSLPPVELLKREDYEKKKSFSNYTTLKNQEVNESKHVDATNAPATVATAISDDDNDDRIRKKMTLKSNEKGKKKKKNITTSSDNNNDNGNKPITILKKTKHQQQQDYQSTGSIISSSTVPSCSSLAPSQSPTATSSTSIKLPAIQQKREPTRNIMANNNNNNIKKHDHSSPTAISQNSKKNSQLHSNKVNDKNSHHEQNDYDDFHGKKEKSKDTQDLLKSMDNLNLNHMPTEEEMLNAFERILDIHRTFEETILPKFKSMMLIDSDLKFHLDHILSNLSDYPGCLVVGVLGKKNVGKTSLISQLLNHSTPSKLPVKATNIVDMYTGLSGYVLLDTMPVFHRSVIQTYHRDKTQMLSEKEYNDSMDSDLRRNQERWLYSFAMQLTLFLMSVCHVLITISDDSSDLDVLELIRAAEAIKFGSSNLTQTYTTPHSSHKLVSEFNLDSTRSTTHSSSSYIGNIRSLVDTVAESSRNTPSTNGSSSTDIESVPYLIHILNKQDSSQFNPYTILKSIKNMGAVMKKSRLSYRSSLSLASMDSTYEESIPLPAKEYNLFVLPVYTKLLDAAKPFEWLETESNDSIPLLSYIVDTLYAIPGRQSYLLENLSESLAKIPRHTIISTTPFVAESIKWFHISEKDWVRKASVIWDNIRKDPNLQKVHLPK